MSLFLKDYYITHPPQHQDKEKQVNQHKTIEANIESYYSKHLKMAGNFDNTASKSTRSGTFTSLKAFIDTMATEDPLKQQPQPLSFRSWF
jgi:hypothetical protein